MKKLSLNIAAFIMLLLILSLGLWLFFLGREVLTGLLRTYFVGGSIARGYQAGLYDRVLTMLLGLGWLVVFVVAEEWLRRGTIKGNMLQVFARFMGVECLLALLLDGMMLFFLTDFTTVGWVRWLVLVVWLAGSISFLFLGWSKRSPWYKKRISGIIEPLKP